MKNWSHWQATRTVVEWRKDPGKKVVPEIARKSYVEHSSAFR